MSLFDLLEKIVGAESDPVEIEVPEENFNLLMLRTLQDKAKKEGKKLLLNSTGPKSQNLISSLAENGEPQTVEVAKGKKKRRINLAGIKRYVWVPALVLLLLALLAGGAYLVIYYLPKAEVVLTLDPIPLVKEIPVVADIKASEVNAEEGVIPGSSYTIEVSGEKTANATGTAVVGERAKGSITLLNCDKNNTVTFSAGTVLTVEGKNLSYTLDSNVSDVPVRVDNNCGEKVGAITATEIGSNYNQGENVYFDFSSYSNDAYDAYISPGQSVTGGSSEEVTIVSADDRSKLLEELRKELTKEGKQDISDEGGLDEVVVSEAVKNEVVEKNFSHEVGKQTDKLTLNLKMKFTTITYKGANMQDLISQTIGSLVPEGYELFPGETNVESLEAKLSKDKLSFQAKVSSQVVPQINEEEIKEELAGRNPFSAQEYLSSLGDVVAYELKLWPNVPQQIQRIPRNTNRINVTLITQ